MAQPVHKTSLRARRRRLQAKTSSDKCLATKGRLRAALLRCLASSRGWHRATKAEVALEVFEVPFQRHLDLTRNATNSTCFRSVGPVPANEPRKPIRAYRSSMRQWPNVISGLRFLPRKTGIPTPCMSRHRTSQARLRRPPLAATSFPWPNAFKWRPFRGAADNFGEPKSGFELMPQKPGEPR